MRLPILLLTLLSGLLLASNSLDANNANRLTYLDEFLDPYWVGLDMPKLTTPQWFGEEGVDAVIVLSIDDMFGPEGYEKYLRPILDRLKKIDGRAPVSIMTCRTPTDHAQHQTWLAEGVSLEAHTTDHPCPLFQKGDFDNARKNYENSVDLMFSIPNNHPVSFRMPCFDSMNTQSPRFFAELFNGVTEQGNFLKLDSSIANIPTPNDPALPRGVVQDHDGGERFDKYTPHGYAGRFANWIEDYPYPYVIGKLCWEMPSTVPDDWTSQHLHGTNNPKTVEDWKVGIEAIVQKQGQFTFTFHPHGWIHNDLIVGVIDHVAEKYGSRVRFVTFAEVAKRIDAHLLDGHPLRAANGEDNGVRILDVNNDGYMDVVIANDKVQKTRVWSPIKNQWVDGPFPTPIVRVDDQGRREETGVRFGVLRARGQASVLIRNEETSGLWHYKGPEWIRATENLDALRVDGPVYTSQDGRDRGVRLRDLDGDGICELIVGNESQSGVFEWDGSSATWSRLPFTLPANTSIVSAQGRDAGLRFADIDEDGHDDVLFSNAKRYSLHLFRDLMDGWSRETIATDREDATTTAVLPMFIRADGSNNGAWIKHRRVWAQNEDVGKETTHVSFTRLLENADAPPRSPQESLASIRVRRGFRVELMAAEPMVQDPVNFEWGPDGKLWVVEMADYPLGLDDKGKPGGRIRFLEDRTGNGQYDRSTVFLDEIPFPTSVLPWGKGVLVTAAPDVFYAEDTNGDGVADHREVFYRGFGTWNQQHLVNGLRWGLDNWIYIANGDSGGTVTSVKTGTTVDISGRDLRVRPDTGLIEAQNGQSQYGRERDDWGNWFSCNNPNQGWHYALLDHYTRRNPHVAPPDPSVDLARDRRVYPGGRILTHCFLPLPPLDNAAGTFTSACGITIYRDDLYGKHFQNNTFTSEPIHNAIHRRVLVPNGVTFKSHRAPGEHDREFLSSSDPWFRPTTIRTGPDGTLWFADMYRLVLEHPEWIDDDLEKTLDLRQGHDRGRLYRVVPIDRKPRRIPRLDHLDAEELVAALDSPSGWQRDTAHRMLVRRGDRSALPPLRTLMRTTHPGLALARVHALGVLEALDGLTPKIIAHALGDAHPGVRRHALRVGESMIASSSQVAQAALSLISDDDPHVQLQLAYSLGAWSDPRAGEALGQLALRHHGDRFITAAVLSSCLPAFDDVISTICKAPPEVARHASLSQLVPVSIATSAEHPTSLRKMIDLIGAPGSDGTFDNWQLDAFENLLNALSNRGSWIQKLHDESLAELKPRIKKLENIFEFARKIANDSDQPHHRRARVARILGRGFKKDARDVETVTALINPQTPPGDQIQLVKSLNRLSDDRIPELLLANFTSHTPRVRVAVLDTCMSREPWTKTLLDQLRKQPAMGRAFDAARRKTLLDRLPEGDRAEAESLLGGKVATDRQKVVEDYGTARSLAGNAENGKALFESVCSRCHHFKGVGKRIGPDLATLANKTFDSLLTAVLDPNRAVEDKYVAYAAITVDGRALTGLIASETATSITLVNAEGEEVPILRSELVSLQGSGQSAMPEGLEKDLDHQKLADLFEFLLAP